MLDEDLKKLEELVKKMEAGNLSLENGLEAFSQGLELVKKCTKELEAAELKVKEIIESGNKFEALDLKS